MMKVKYSKAAIDALPRPATGQKIYWFENGDGFGIRLTPGARSFIFEKRVKGVKRRVLVCKVPSSFDKRFLDSAWSDSRDLSATFAKGIDPVAKARAEQDAQARAADEKARQDAAMLTLGDAFQRYADAPKQKGADKGRAKKPRTKRDIMESTRHFSDWLDTPVTAITGDMVTKRHGEIVARADAARLKAGKAATGHSAQAELALRYLRAAMNHVNNSSDDDLPIVRPKIIQKVGNLIPATPRRKTRNISDARIPEWVEAVRNGFDGREYGSVYRDALLFILLTGARLAEVMGNSKDGYLPLTWQNVDFGKRTVTFRNTKNRSDHTLPMGDALTMMMQNRKDVSRSDIVFSDEAGRIPTNLRGGYDRIKDLTGIHATPHDLRRTFATVAARLKLSEMELKRLLNHTKAKDDVSIDDNASIEESDITRGYVHIRTDDLREPMQRIEDHMLRPRTEDQAET